MEIPTEFCDSCNHQIPTNNMTLHRLACLRKNRRAQSPSPNPQRKNSPIRSKNRTPNAFLDDLRRGVIDHSRHAVPDPGKPENKRQITKFSRDSPDFIVNQEGSRFNYGQGDVNIFTESGRDDLNRNFIDSRQNRDNGGFESERKKLFKVKPKKKRKKKKKMKNQNLFPKYQRNDISANVRNNSPGTKLFLKNYNFLELL